MADLGFSVAGYNRHQDKVEALRREAKGLPVRGAASIEEFIALLRKPRAVMLLVTAGKAVDAVIAELLPYLEKGDLIIDAGNSYFKDTNRRAEKLAACSINFLGVGVSGGEEGVRLGPSIMPGGPQAAYQRVKPVFEAVAAKVNGAPCVEWLGHGSAGHFVKMVHNGIEYAVMQLIAEIYDLMKRGLGLSNTEVHEAFSGWNSGELNSYLLEITGHIFAQLDDKTGKPLIDLILGAAKQKGTGVWTSQSAMELQVPTPTIDLAVDMRDLSVFAREREDASLVLARPIRPFTGDRAASLGELHNEVLTMQMGPDFILVNLSVDFVDPILVTDVELTVTGLDRKIKTAYPQVKHIFVEIETWRSKEELIDTTKTMIPHVETTGALNRPGQSSTGIGERQMLILAGDIGGTSTRLAFFEAVDGELAVVAEKHYASGEHGSLTDIVKLFVEEDKLAPEQACFGIAGPVIDGKVKTPNLPWSIDAANLARVLGLPAVKLINDLAANAYGIALLQDKDFEVLNPGKADPTGTIAVVSAGTGLGEAFAYWDGAFHQPLPSEAGHADFAPRSRIETELLLYLQAEFGRVSYERVVSGPGLFNIYRFFRDVRHLPESPEVALAMHSVDPAIAITHAALNESCPLCSKALDLFMTIYGAEAGNAALRFFAPGGIYIGGGIAPKIIEKLKGSGFMEAFLAKGRLSPLLASTPVKVILNDRTALLGAGRCAFIQQGKSQTFPKGGNSSL